ncbi:hypothetical protein ACROYT_G015297 [Oculina patagonica]
MMCKAFRRAVVTEHERTLLNYFETLVSGNQKPVKESCLGFLSPKQRIASLTRPSKSRAARSTGSKLHEERVDFQGRTGSNACVFIALHMEKLCAERNLTWPTGDLLPITWETALHDAMAKGNKIHDDLFDHDATDVTVEEAESLAGEECGVRTLGQQTDIFGFNPVNQLTNWLIQTAQNVSRSFSVIVSDEQAFLIVVNSDQSAMVVDSHSHGNGGAIIACCQRRNVMKYHTVNK